MGTSPLCNVGIHQPVAALDCLYPVTGRYYVGPNRLEVICSQISRRSDFFVKCCYLSCLLFAQVPITPQFLPGLLPESTGCMSTSK